jgi:trk system potassium uptake protein TrkH
LREIKPLIYPSAVLPIKLGKLKVEERITSAVWGFFGLYFVSFTIMMLLGRLEIFTVLVLLTPSFWRN